MMIVRSFVIGMNITIIDPASDPLLSLSKNERFDFTAMVPLQIENCLNHASEKISILNGMKAILVGGAPVSSSLEKKIERISSPVLLTFGMTETISHVALRRLNGERKEGYYRALEEVKFEKDNRECLIIHSPLSEEPVITNDVVQLLSKDKFIWKGRFDNVINSGGIKVHPETVESKLQKIFEEANLNIPFFVAGMLDEKLGEKVCLFVEGEKLSEKEKEKILRMFPHRELGYESPRQCYFIKRFEYTESGKVKRKESMKLNLQL
jgi:O-succinylbenzoic acid--CoA ligase